MEAEAVSYSFAYFEEPVSPTGMPHPASVWGVVPSLTATWHVMFEWQPWVGLPFFEGKRGRGESGERVGVRGGIGWRGKKGNCGQNVIHERRIKNKITLLEINQYSVDGRDVLRRETLILKTILILIKFLTFLIWQGIVRPRKVFESSVF